MENRKKIGKDPYQVMTKYNMEKITDGKENRDNSKFEGQSIIFNDTYKNLTKQDPIRLYFDADPNDLGRKISAPIGIISNSCKLVNAEYTGENNLGSEELASYINSTSSKLLSAIDGVQTKLTLNYLYLDSISHQNSGLINQFIKTMSEAESFVYSTQLFNLPFFTTYYKCDAFTDSSDKAPTTAGRFGVLYHYQTFLQNLAMVIAKYNSTLAMYQHLADMSYNREANLMSVYYGQLRKSANRALFESLSAAILGEYFDKDWYNQCSALYTLPSRRSKSFQDPLLTMVFSYENSLVTAKNSSGVVFTTDDYYNKKAIGTYTYLKLTQDSSGKGICTVETVTSVADQPNSEFAADQVCFRLAQTLDPITLLAAARAGIESQAITNCLKSMVDVLQLAITSFKINMSDVRIFLERANASNFVYWKKNQSWSLYKDNVNYEPARVKPIEDITKCVVTGDTSLVWDANLQRFKFRDIWNVWSGLPGYSLKNGGAFITIPTRAASQAEQSKILPMLFKNVNTSGNYVVTLISRNGKTYSVKRNTISSTDLNNDKVFSRLDLLSTGSGDFSIPIVKQQTTGTNADYSMICKTLLRLYGIGVVKSSDGGTEYNLLDNDSYSLITLQLADMSNQMIQFSRTYCPFRIINSTESRPIGFKVGTKSLGDLK